MAFKDETDTGLDQARIEALSIKILEHLKANYQRGPISRDRVYESLNALACATAAVVQGTGQPEEAKDFFDRAFNIINS